MTITRSTPVSELPEFLKVEEFAELMNCSRGLAYTMATSGQIASVRLGRLLRIPRSAIEKLLQGNGAAK